MINNSELIYHGSYMEIEFPEIRKHRFTKDFSCRSFAPDKTPGGFKIFQ